MKAFTKNNNDSSTSSTRSQDSTPFFGIQAKLSVGEPNDKYEKEADSMADQVVAKSGQSDSFFSSSDFFPASTPNTVQKLPFEEVQQQDEAEEIQEKPLADSITPVVQLQPLVIQEKCSACEEEDKNVQTKSSRPNQSSASGAFENKLSSSKGSGSQLNGNSKAEMESAFGTDFSNVRIHTDSNAVAMSQEIGAQAFTNGRDIYFNEGKYNPTSNSGKHLLAHELTHTIQQGGSSGVAQNKIQRWPGWADSAANWVTDTASSAASSVADGAMWVGGQVADGAEWVGGQVADGAAWVGDQLSEAYDWLIERINGAINSGTDYLDNKWEEIKAFGTSSFDDIKNGFSALASLITSPMSTMVAALSDMNADFLEGTFNDLKAGGNALLAGINSVVNDVLAAGETIWSTITGFIDGIFDTIDGLFNNSAFNLLPDFITSGLRSALSGLRSLWNRVSSFWTDLWDRLTSFAREIIDAVQSFVENAINFGIEQIISMVRNLKELYDFVMATLMDPAGTVAPMVEAIARKISEEGPGKSHELGNQLALDNFTGDNSQAQDNGTIQRVVIDGEERTTASISEVIEGIMYYLGEAWKGLTMSKILEMLWKTVTDLIWPWSSIGQQFVTLWNDEWATAYNSLYMPRNLLVNPIGCLHDIWSNYMILFDFPIALMRTLNNVVGLLMGWIAILMMLIGAVIGGLGGAMFFGVAIPAGIGAGAAAGLAVMEPLGLILAASIIGTESNAAAIIMGRLFTANQVCEKRQVDIMQAVTSVITAAVTIVVAVLMALLAKLIALIAEFLKGAPKGIPTPDPVPVPAPGLPAPAPAPPLPVPSPPARPVPVRPAPSPAAPPPNVIPFPGRPQPGVPQPGVPDRIAAKFEDDEDGATLAQMMSEENEETPIIQTARIDNINPDACDDDDDELPQTEVNNNMDSIGRASYVIADPLTRIPGDPGGSNPTTDPSVPRGWPHVRSFDLDYDKDKVLRVMNWVKFHLLHNLRMHGPGEGWNLVPASKKDNSAYYGDFEETMVNKLGPTSNGIYTYEITVDGYREATDEAPYLSDFPVSLTINAKEYNDYHNDRSKTTPIFSGKNFTFKDSPLRSRSPDEVKSFIMNNGGRTNLVNFTQLGEWGARQFAAISGASSVSDIGRQLVEEPSDNRSQFETKLGYLRDVRDSLGPFLRNDVHEANVFLFNENENVDVIRGEVSQKIAEYESVLRDNNHITLKSKFDKVVEADNGLGSNDVKNKIQDEFDINRDLVNKYLRGATRPNPYVIRDIITFLNTLYND
ncbi:eCIS core domain-containing protein [Flavivirga jejuensis]|uniref:DUF4157 domain-containing protein n=1 Tax=Flavivirga jejuensis TaxID=870487 RepID=A0ABT8WQM3_9FLAO|nr:DUF4157 domain-containing protein [Flavivirga jejuensis]MDO5975206.1 DUF4157 domain-containing protein [Flavivirga jejuensis]